MVELANPFSRRWAKLIAQLPPSTVPALQRYPVACVGRYISNEFMKSSESDSLEYSLLFSLPGERDLSDWLTPKNAPVGRRCFLQDDYGQDDFLYGRFILISAGTACVESGR